MQLQLIKQVDPNLGLPHIPAEDAWSEALRGTGEEAVVMRSGFCGEALGPCLQLPALFPVYHAGFLPQDV